MKMNKEDVYQSVQKVEEMSLDEIKKLQAERLRTLVEYARTHSKLYADLYADLKDSYTLQDLPVTNKALLTSRMDDWFTDPELTSENIDHFLNENTDPCRKLLDKYSVITTSGTSGKPMPMLRDCNHEQVAAALIAHRLFKGIDLQLLNPLQSKITGVICTRGNVSSYSSYRKMLKAAGISEDKMPAISVLDPIPSIVKRLNEFQPDTWTGYPSVMANLAHEQIAGRLHIHPKVIACSAETLSNENYRLLRKVFGCPVLNNYCSTEGGEIAMSCSEGHLHLNMDWSIVEPIDAQGNPVREGEMSDAILLTNLSNFVQPIIRYRVEDHVRIDYSPCPCGCKLPVIEIVGRKIDTFVIKGRQLNTVLVMALMDGETGIIDYQLIQVAEDKLELRARIAGAEDTSAERERVCKKIALLLQQNDFCGVEVVGSDLPPFRNERGGKVRNFIPLEDYRKLS